MVAATMEDDDYPLPLTERVLVRLSGRRAVWTLLWGTLAALAYEVVFRIYRNPTYPGLRFVISFAYLNFAALVGVGFLRRWLREAERAVAPLTEGLDLSPRTHPFRNASSVFGVLVLTMAFTLLFEVADFFRYPSLGTAALIPIVFIGKLPSTTLIWAYFAVLVGLHRFGRMRLNLQSYWVDLSLGLRPLGSLALRITFVMAGVFLPFLFFGLTDARALIAVLALTALGVVLFFLSLNQLHRQLAAARLRYVHGARRLYADVFEPLVTAGTGEILGTQSLALNAAVEVERRATAIQEWPFDTAILARLAALVTSVIISVMTRLVLNRFGL